MGTKENEKWLFTAATRYPEENTERYDYTEIYPNKASAVKRAVLQILREIKFYAPCFSSYQSVPEKEYSEFHFGIVIDKFSKAIMGEDYKSIIFPKEPIREKLFGVSVDFAFVNYNKFYEYLVQYCISNSWDHDIYFNVVNFVHHTISDCYLSENWGKNGKELEYATPDHIGCIQPLEQVPELTVDFVDGDFTIDKE